MHDPDLDARQAAAIAAGMKAVALADGEPHPAEIDLIDRFVAELPPEVDVSDVRFQSAAAREALLRSLFLVALVDGGLKEAELETIREIARAHGATADEFTHAEARARRQLLARLQGVKVFRDRALEVADELGVPRDEATRILDGATD